MRIVTRPDFDGIVCAVLLKEAEDISSDIYWIEPNDIQAHKADIRDGDILANLPYSSQCSLWFDHHISNKPAKPVPGSFDVAPSAAGVIYDYYKNKGTLDDRLDTLVLWTDIIDSADLDQDQVMHPENYPYILLSMTIKNESFQDIDYWNHLVDLLSHTHIDEVLRDDQVKKRCHDVVRENERYAGHLLEHTVLDKDIAVTDFRSVSQVPNGNRFLPYCLFPEVMATVKIRYAAETKDKVQLSVGASIFNRTLNVNIGRLLSKFGGGGHAGAGGCTLNSESADADIQKIFNTLSANKKEGAV